MHLLVVDPNVAFATLLTEELTRLGHDAVACYSGEDAYAFARRTETDLALIDMGLEDPDAITLARDLRKLNPSTRLMLIPMFGEEPALAQDAPSIQGVLPKPFFMPELPDRIDAALSAVVLPAEPIEDATPTVAPAPHAAETLVAADGEIREPIANDIGTKPAVEPRSQASGDRCRIGPGACPLAADVPAQPGAY